jgi:hypothetical protein
VTRDRRGKGDKKGGAEDDGEDPNGDGPFGRGDQVHTPYGNGIVVRKQIENKNIFEIQLIWGYGYFFNSNIKLIKKKIRFYENNIDIKDKNISVSTNQNNTNRVRMKKENEDEWKIKKNDLNEENFINGSIKQKKSKHQISGDEVRGFLNSTKEDPSSLDSVETKDGKYLYTNSFLLMVIKKIVGFIGLGGQTFVANMISSNVANMSLWLNGRTTKILNRVCNCTYIYVYICICIYIYVLLLSLIFLLTL